MKLSREEIHAISKHSNWSAGNIKTTLKNEVYADKASWNKLIRLIFISLGLGFTVSGVIFFFAYNWADMHKFVKLGLIEALIMGMTAVVLFSKLSLGIRNMILTGTSMLVGVLFAIFGQIYQTGANAYDFFLGWTIWITLWVCISNYPPLWLLFLTLINTTLILYAQQIAHDWSVIFVFNVLFVINTGSVIMLKWLFHRKYIPHLPPWFTSVVALASVSYITLSIAIGIMDDYQTSWLMAMLMAGIAYPLAIQYSLRIKSGFYVALIPLSVIIIVSTFLIHVSDHAPIGMLFMVSIFILVSVTLVIKNIINLQKKWYDA